ncbi:MAG: hypothetical protein KGQ70_09345, partial [Alphaproteobacteria bacterium]|nr:hypothetical protein [Alphaproteobacteria bacterium]
MPKKDTVIFIVADETRYGGEADYMKGLAAELKKRGLREDTDYFVYKAVRGASGSDPRVLPLNNDQYAAVPYVGEMDARLLTRAGKISLVGAGHSTLDVVIDLAARTGGRAKASYITHMVDDAGHLRKIVGNDVALFATTTQSALCAIDPSCGARAKLVALAAVPHTISKESCQAEYDSFMQFARQSADPEADMRRAILEGNDPFAFVLLNAGFEAGKKGHVPYTAEEAARAGAALGGALPPRTSLILAEGTPRSLMDRKLGEDTMGAFAAAYKRAQMALAGAEDPEETPYVVREFFEPGLPYNIVKAGYVLGGRDNCVAFIS